MYGTRFLHCEGGYDHTMLFDDDTIQYTIDGGHVRDLLPMNSMCSRLGILLTDYVTLPIETIEVHNRYGELR